MSEDTYKINGITKTMVSDGRSHIAWLEILTGFYIPDMIYGTVSLTARFAEEELNKYDYLPESYTTHLSLAQVIELYHYLGIVIEKHKLMTLINVEEDLE